MEKYVSSIQDLINSLFDTMMSGADVLVGVSTTIAGLGCLIYVATLLLPAIERGQRIEFYPLLKPLIVAIVITNFPALTSIVSNFSTKVGTSISKMVSTGDVNNYYDLFQSKVDELIKQSQAATPSIEEKSILDETSGSSVNTTPNSSAVDDFFKPKAETDDDDGGMSFFHKLAMQIFYGYILPTAVWIVMFIGQIFYILLYIMSKFFLVVLAIVGPLSFALSQFKYFSGSISQWLARFISVSLWPGICGLVRGINHKIVVAIAENLEATITSVFVAIILLVFAATLYLKVPTLAEFIIRSGGIGGADGAAKRGGSAMLRKIQNKIGIGGN